MKILKLGVVWSVSVFEIFIIINFFLSFSTYVLCEYEYLIHSQRLSKFRCSDVCKDIVCEKVKNCVNGTIVLNGSYCNCCDVCVKLLNEDDLCDEVIEGSLRKTTLSKCKPGLTCKNEQCVIDDFERTYDCLKQRNLRESKKGTGHYSVDLWVPECDEDGHYKAKQHKNRKNICIDEDGNTLFGSADDSLKNTCACSRHMLKIQKENSILYNVKPQEHCTAAGSFDSLQCIGNLCYCADEETGEITSRLVRRDNLDKLPIACYNIDESKSSYITDCEVELQRSKHLIYEFHLKGVELVGIIKVRCDPDGTFEPTQCQSDRCACTNENGVGIGSYAITTENLEKDNVIMTCNCARDEASTQAPFKCKAHGNYVLYQCFNSEQCNCVDEDGDIISTQLPRASTNVSYCEQLLQELFNHPENKIKSTLADTKTSEPDNVYSEYDYIL